jgi:hypothetical protein
MYEHVYSTCCHIVMDTVHVVSIITYYVYVRLFKQLQSSLKSVAMAVYGARIFRRGFPAWPNIELV